MNLFRSCDTRTAAARKPRSGGSFDHPTGVTLHDPQETWAGFTVLSLLRPPHVVVIDMNGTVVRQWDDFNTSAGGPARILPGGEVIAPTGARPRFQESLALEQRGFDGRLIWRLAHNEEIPLADQRVDSLRQHHDWQRADFPAGYYSPEFRPASRGSRTLVLTHTTRTLPDISPRVLQDDRLMAWMRGASLGMERRRSCR